MGLLPRAVAGYAMTRTDAFPFLLVSESKKFCLYCHNGADIAKNEAHKGVDADCTECHDAHASNNDYLLK